MKRLNIIFFLFIFGFSIYYVSDVLMTQDLSDVIVSKIDDSPGKNRDLIEKIFQGIILEDENPISILSRKKDAASNRIGDGSEVLRNEPLIYIYNTHQLEEYSSLMPYEYSVRPNVMIASYIMREKLGEEGVSAIVETNNIKEYLSKSDMSYNKSYLASEYFAREAQTKYPSISYLIDIHRDSVSKNATYTEIDGKPYARVLLVTGMEHTTPGNSDGFAEALNEILEKKYPGLSRGILNNGGTPVHAIYNQNLNGKSVLFEVGGVDNKIEEVNNTMEALSKVLSEYIRSV